MPIEQGILRFPACPEPQRLSHSQRVHPETIFLKAIPRFRFATGSFASRSLADLGFLLADAQLAAPCGKALVHAIADVMGHIRIRHFLGGEKNGWRSYMQRLQEIGPLLHQPLLLNGVQTMLPQDSATVIVIPEHAAVGVLLRSFVGVASINGLGEGQPILVPDPGLAEVMTAVDSRDAKVSAKLCQGEPDFVAGGRWRL